MLPVASCVPRRPGGETGLVVGLMTEMYGGSKRKSREDVVLRMVAESGRAWRGQGRRHLYLKV